MSNFGQCPSANPAKTALPATNNQQLTGAKPHAIVRTHPHRQNLFNNLVLRHSFLEQFWATPVRIGASRWLSIFIDATRFALWPEPKAIAAAWERAGSWVMVYRGLRISDVGFFNINRLRGTSFFSAPRRTAATRIRGFPTASASLAG